MRFSQWSQSSFLSQNAENFKEVNETEIDSEAKLCLNNSSCVTKGKGCVNSVAVVNNVAHKSRSEVRMEATALLNEMPKTPEKEATQIKLNLNKSSENLNDNNVYDYVTGGNSLSQMSMSQTENGARALVNNLPLSQAKETHADRGVENYTNKELSVKIPELLIDILDTMLQVSNEEFVGLYFQWKLHLLHENDWWVNATHNDRNTINRKHLLVLQRLNQLELEVMTNKGTKFYSKLTLQNLRTNLIAVCSIAVSVSNLKKTQRSKLLKNKRKEYLALRKEIGIVPRCYQNMSLERDVFFDHKPLCNNCYRLPSSKVKKREVQNKTKGKLRIGKKQLVKRANGKAM